MYDPEMDGVEHINIYSKGKTSLGRTLSNFCRLSVIIDGKTFQSIEAYWYWLSTGERYDELRHLYGFRAKQEGKKYPVVPVDGFEDFIRRALRLKIGQYPGFRKEVAESTLPFVHYYTFGENPPVVRDAGFKWIVEEWEKIRKELKDV